MLYLTYWTKKKILIIQILILLFRLAWVHSAYSLQFHASRQSSRQLVKTKEQKMIVTEINETSELKQKFAAIAREKRVNSHIRRSVLRRSLKSAKFIWGRLKQEKPYRIGSSGWKFALRLKLNFRIFNRILLKSCVKATLNLQLNLGKLTNKGAQNDCYGN